MKRQELINHLANFIQQEAQDFFAAHPEIAEQSSEPYRAAADRLVDEALALVD